MRSRPLLMGLVAATAACGPGANGLGGSLSEVFPLEVSRVEAVQNDEALQVTYLRNLERELDIVLRLTVALGPEESLAKGLKLSLEGESPQGFRRTTVSHVPGGEPLRDLGEVSQGELLIHEGGEPGQTLRGEFSLRFPEGDTLAAGRNVFGNFEVELDSVGGD